METIIGIIVGFVMGVVATLWYLVYDFKSIDDNEVEN